MKKTIRKLIVFGFTIATFTSVNAATNDLVCIDAGHQTRANNGQEAIGPNTSITKPKISSGTQGVSTKKPEYKLTLELALKLKTKLSSNGYKVFMIRETNDVNISNKERAQLANQMSCSAYIRIHADGSDNRSINGISMQSSSKNNPYIRNMYDKNSRLSNLVLSETIKATGAKNRGINYRDDLTGTNWSNVPTTLIEVGFMSNPEEDNKLSSDSYQEKLVNGMYNGITSFLNN